MQTKHQEEADQNLEVWHRKPLLRKVYRRLHERIRPWLRSGESIEIGSGFGSLRETVPGIRLTESWVRPWLDVALSAYQLPFRNGSLGNVVAVDVFHHLARPVAMMKEASRVLATGGRLILIEPYISIAGRIIYGLFHEEKIAFHDPIDGSDAPAGPEYYTAQGNATRIFFGTERSHVPGQLRVLHAARFAAFAYALTGGFSRPAFYPEALEPMLDRVDRVLSAVPALFAVRCLVVLERV